MTAAVVTSAFRSGTPASAAVRSRDALAATWQLVRFNLWRDRRRLLIWIASIAGLYAYCATAFATLFADPAEQQARAALMNSPASVLMAGPRYGIDHYWFGPIMANELLLWFAAALALMSIMQVVRWTRAEEESSRSELIRSAVVGRHAPAVAAFVSIVIVNLVIAVVTAPILFAGLPRCLPLCRAGTVGTAGTAGTGDAMQVCLAICVTRGNALPDVAGYVLGIALVALCFAAVALLTAQLTAHARGASGLALAALFTALLVRGFGDIPQVGGTALSWFSPVAWAQQTRTFVEMRWWPLLLPLAFIAVLLAIASLLGSRRDFGAGMIAARLGRAAAPSWLASPVALVWRQQRTASIWWTIGMFVMFFATGTYLVDVGAMFDELIATNPLLAGMFGVGDITGAFVRIMLVIAGLCAAGFGISAVNRARTEEAEHRSEVLLAAPVSRFRLLAAQLGVPGVVMIVLVLLSALGLYLGAESAGFDGPGLGSYLLSGLVFLPATGLVVALAAALFAWAPRWIPAAYLLVVWGMIDGLFGGLIDAPAPMRALNPFHQVPTPMASGPHNYLPVWGLTALTVGLVVLAFVGFRRRDVPTV